MYAHIHTQVLTGDEDDLFSDAPVHSDNLSVRMENPTPTFCKENSNLDIYNIYSVKYL